MSTPETTRIMRILPSHDSIDDLTDRSAIYDEMLREICRHREELTLRGHWAEAARLSTLIKKAKG